MTETFKYRFSDKKRRCPNCGHHNRFRTFEDIDGRELPDIYGVCDRVNSCKYENRPKDNYIVKDVVQKPVIKSIEYIPEQEMLETQLNLENNILYKWLITKYNSNLVKKVFQDYYVGTMDFYGDSPIFWRIDGKGRVRTGKVMRYNVNGKRYKGKGASFKWMHKKGFTFEQVPFGTHLVNKGDIVNVVESEKTALIMACEQPYKKWIAVGGSNNLAQLKLVKGAGFFILHPDSGMYRYWMLKCIDYKLFNTSVISYEHLPSGDDIADSL